MDRYDIAIIGTGPAGLSAAVTAKIRNKKIILFGSNDLSAKIGKAHAVQNYLGLPAVTGENMHKAFHSHLDALQIAITEGRVNAVYPMGTCFSIEASGQLYEADSVILATGVVMEKPYPGENEFLGRGVSYCATCDAPLYKKKTVAVIAFGKQEEAEADFLAEVAGKVYYFPMYKEPVQLSDKIQIIREIPESVTGTTKVQQLKTKENSYDVDGIFILRESIAPGQLVPGIVVADNHVQVNRLMETSIAGVFACGDIVGKPYQYIKSAGEGNIAALSAVNYIDQKKRTEVK
ncbi:MAG: NAD(P)/FAD-dependent oxidoreductase [Treponema sp.]|nr:NAD(P)/FAD-dependent oxidoreductase [Treponema sp.]